MEKHQLETALAEVENGIESILQEDLHMLLDVNKTISQWLSFYGHNKKYQDKKKNLLTLKNTALEIKEKRLKWPSRQIQA
jgi:hypothetical protein